MLQQLIENIRTLAAPLEAAPGHVAKAIEAINTFTQRASCEKDILRYHAWLWTFGDAVGSACRRKGFETGRQEMSPKPGRIRIDRFVPGGPIFPVTIAVLAYLDPVRPTLNLPSATYLPTGHSRRPTSDIDGNSSIDRMTAVAPSAESRDTVAIPQRTLGFPSLVHWRPLVVCKFR